jgi:FAD/FMN-containing dehydrogenase
MAATNAAGAHSLRHGAMRPWVRALDCVFADGTRAWCAAARRRPTCRRAPLPRRRGAARARGRRAPASRSPTPCARSRRATRGRLAALGRAGRPAGRQRGDARAVRGRRARARRAARRHGERARRVPLARGAVLGAEGARAAGAAACELLDRTFLDVAAAGGALPPPRRTRRRRRGARGGAARRGGGGRRGAAAPPRGRWARVPRGGGAGVSRSRSTRGGARAVGAAARREPDPRAARPGAQEHAVRRGRLRAAGRLAEYVRGVRAALARQGMRGVIFGHAGDAHVHVNPLVDVRAPDWRARVEALLDEVSRARGALGGTLAGEHGDGRLRAPLLARTWRAEALACSRRQAGVRPRGGAQPGREGAARRAAAARRRQVRPGAPAAAGRRAARARPRGGAPGLRRGPARRCSLYTEPKVTLVARPSFASPPTCRSSGAARRATASGSRSSPAGCATCRSTTRRGAPRRLPREHQAAAPRLGARARELLGCCSRG